MACRTLELTLVSARDLRAVNHVSKMEVYAVVYLAGDPRSWQRVPTDRAGGRSPSWNSDATVAVTIPASGSGCGVVRVLLRTERALGGDRDVGEVLFPLPDIVTGAGDGPTDLTLVCVPVRRVGSSSRHHGVLNLSYKLGGVMRADALAPRTQKPLLAKAVGPNPSMAYLATAASVYSASKPPPCAVAPLGVACTGMRHAQ